MGPLWNLTTLYALTSLPSSNSPWRYVTRPCLIPHLTLYPFLECWFSLSSWGTPAHLLKTQPGYHLLHEASPALLWQAQPYLPHPYPRQLQFPWLSLHRPVIHLSPLHDSATSLFYILCSHPKFSAASSSRPAQGQRSSVIFANWVLFMEMYKNARGRWSPKLWPGKWIRFSTLAFGKMV